MALLNFFEIVFNSGLSLTSIVEQVLYSAEWTGDRALGEAIIAILCDELKRRQIPYWVDSTEGFSDVLDLIPERLGPSDKLRRVLVPQGVLDMATEAMDYVLTKRGVEVKDEALRIAKVNKYVANEEEYEEYSQGLHETYGW